MLYNGLIRVRNRLTHALGLIEIQLKRRYDLIPRLLECVKGISEYEREVQELVASVRSSAASGTKHGVGEIAEEMNQGVGLVGRLFALSEKYPNLSADQNYASFMKELVDTRPDCVGSRLLQRQPACPSGSVACLSRPFGRQMVPLQGREESESSAGTGNESSPSSFSLNSYDLLRTGCREVTVILLSYLSFPSSASQENRNFPRLRSS